jgi:hypothetical protein
VIIIFNLLNVSGATAMARKFVLCSRADPHRGLMNLLVRPAELILVDVRMTLLERKKVFGIADKYVFI